MRKMRFLMQFRNFQIGRRMRTATESVKGVVEVDMLVYARLGVRHSCRYKYGAVAAQLSPNPPLSLSLLPLLTNSFLCFPSVRAPFQYIIKIESFMMNGMAFLLSSKYFAKRIIRPLSSFPSLRIILIGYTTIPLIWSSVVVGIVSLVAVFSQPG